MLIISSTHAERQSKDTLVPSCSQFQGASAVQLCFGHSAFRVSARGSLSVTRGEGVLVSSQPMPLKG